MGRIECDPDKCSGCLACVVACMDQHYDETEGNAVSGRIYEKWISPKTGMTCYKTRSCLHCEDPSCVKACRTGALFQNSGYVLTDREKCVGCRACARACPHDVPRFDADGKIVKCDGCATRVACGLEPACVSTCNTGALKIG